VFLSFFVYATPVLELERTSLQPRETLIGKLHTSGEFKEQLSSEDIRFYSGQKREYFEHELFYYDNAYYLYVIFNKEGTFSIRTDEILYSLAGEVGSRSIDEIVTVAYDDPNKSVQESLLSIEPGVVYTFGKTANLNLFNRGSSSLDISVGDTSFTIGPLQAKTLSLNLELPLSYVHISTYKSFSVPVIYLGAPVVNESEINYTNQTPEVVTSNLVVRRDVIDFNASKNETLFEEVELANLGEGNITSMFVLSNISMAVIDVPYSIQSMDSGFLSVNIFAGETSRNETIILTYVENNTQFNITIPLIINIQDDNTSTTINHNTSSNKPTCLETGGMLCNGDCDNSSFTTDGFCCYSECIPFSANNTGIDNPADRPSYGWIIGLLIFLVIAIVAYLVFTKYKRTAPESPERKINHSKEKFEERMRGKPENVRDSLSRH